MTTKSPSHTEEHLMNRIRARLASLLVCLGVVALPAAIVVGWVGALASNTAAFTAVSAPLIGESTVKTYLADATATAIVDRVDLAQVMPQAAVPLAKQQLRLAVRDGALRLFASGGFQTAWTQSLSAGHTQLVRLLDGDSGALADAERDGGIGLPLQAFSEQLNRSLVDAGVPLADRLPVATGVIVIVPTDKVVALRPWYQALRLIAVWLPVIAGALIVAGVVIAPKRRATLLWGAALLALLAAGCALLAAAAPGMVSGADQASVAMATVVRQVTSPAVPMLWWLAGGAAVVVVLATVLRRSTG